jgi:hypothetical protein
MADLLLGLDPLKEETQGSSPSGLGDHVQRAAQVDVLGISWQQIVKALILSA